MENGINQIIKVRPRQRTELEKHEKVSKQDVQQSEFRKILDDHQTSGRELQVSKHAQKRIEQRKIQLDSSEYMKIKNAIQQLKGKGGKDSLVVTDKAAYVVDVEKNNIVTAVDRDASEGKLFTNIDSTIIV